MTSEPPTKHRVRQLFDYDGKAGLLTWKIARPGPNGNIGDEAGCISEKTGSRHVRVGVDGRIYSAAKIIFIWVTGAPPEGRVTYRNGDPADLRWRNLALKSAGYSQHNSARYQRELRDINIAAKEFVMHDPELFRDYHSSPERARLVMKHVRKLIRERDRREDMP